VLLERLGSGGQGTVYRAHDNARDRTVALKTLGTRGSQESLSLEALTREVHSISKVAAPGIARIIACGKEEDGELYIVQEFIPGRTLRQLLGSGMPAAELVRIAAGIAGTVAGLHAQGVVHADIKPENIVMNMAGKPVLVDFGIALRLGQRARGMAQGTRTYVPPRTLLLWQRADYRDIFALGVILLECLGARIERRGGGIIGDTIRLDPGLEDALGQLRSQEGIDLTQARRVIHSLLTPIAWRRPATGGLCAAIESILR
jgi:serine/threonine-protein kinase